LGFFHDGCRTEEFIGCSDGYFLSNLKEILESFKAQLFHTLDDRLDAFVHGLTDSLTDGLTDSLSMIVFIVFKIH
jgi:hypothetical protein